MQLKLKNRKALTQMGLLEKFLMLLFLCLTQAGHAAEDCDASEQDLCIYVLEQEKVSKVFARNVSYHEISLAIEFQLDNMNAEGGRIQRHVVAPNSDSLLTQLNVLDAHKRSAFEYAYSYQNGSIKAQHDDSVIYHLPYEPGKTYYVGQSCDTDGTHKGDAHRYAIDFIMPVGTPIYAARGGIIIDYYRLSNSGGISSLHIDKGNFIDIRHSDGTIANYHHLRLMGVRVEKGQRVKKGELIGRSGNTGFSTGPHLHFAVTQLRDIGDIESIKVKFRANRGVLSCPRAGLALKSVDIE